MYRICRLRLGPNFGVRLAADKKMLFTVSGLENASLRFLQRNICGHAAEVAPMYDCG